MLEHYYRIIFVKFINIYKIIGPNLVNEFHFYITKELYFRIKLLTFIYNKTKYLNTNIQNQEINYKIEELKVKEKQCYNKINYRLCDIVNSNRLNFEKEDRKTKACSINYFSHLVVFLSQKFNI